MRLLPFVRPASAVLTEDGAGEGEEGNKNCDRSWADLNEEENMLKFVCTSA